MIGKRRISTATTTVVSDGSCLFKTLVVNGGTIGDITLYNANTADATLNCGVIDGGFSGMVIHYDTVFENGLTIVTASATDVLVTFENYDER